MSTATEQAVVIFPDDYDERSEFETPLRGYLSEVVVQLGDGSRFPIFFIDPIRLQQDLTENAALGQPFFAETNMIVLPEVTTQAVRQVVAELARQGYFQHRKPLS